MTEPHAIFAPDALAAGDWTRITQLARDATALAAQV